MLGTDEEAVLTWPAMVVSRLLPAGLVAAGIAVPAVWWSRLPRSRPGLLIVPMFIAALALIGLIPQVRHPLVSDPEVFEGGWFSDLWVRAKFGRLAIGIFHLSFASALAVGLTLTNLDVPGWHFGYRMLVGAAGGSLIPGIGSGIVLRRYGRPYHAQRVIRARSRPIA